MNERTSVSNKKNKRANEGKEGMNDDQLGNELDRLKIFYYL